MIDSLLTLKGSTALWMAGFFVICVLANRGVDALTGTQESIFMLLAVAILAAFLVMGAYTTGKWMFHLLKGDRSHTPPVA